MEVVSSIVGTINGWVWGPWLLVLLFGTHLFMTFRTGFVQRRVFQGIKLSVTKDPDAVGDVSQFGALTTALASTIGTGNIIGVGTAIALGGPGAVLWMWLTGVFGIATKYAESLISVKYRVKDEKGMMLGGAWFALEKGLKMKWLAVIFALFTALAAFGIGNMTQGNAVATLFNQEFNIPIAGSAIVLAILVGVVIIGGIKIITRVCEKLVPFMSALYIVGCIIILVLNYEYIGPAISLILTSAFTPKALGGGFVAYAVMEAARRGISRGLFSNEAGMGSAPIVAAAAQTRNPVRQALVSSTGVFWDTVVICLMTGLVVVSSILKPNDITATTNGSVLVHAAFGQIHVLGPIILTFGLFTFAFSTILGWSYMGEQGAEYLWGVKSNMPYRVLFTIIVFVGALFPLNLVWDIADTLNGLMVIPNIIACLLLNALIAGDTKHYLWDGNINEIDSRPIPNRVD